MTSFSVIIPAAGSGSRGGTSIPKQYVELCGAPVLAHTLRIFAPLEACREIIVAVDEQWRSAAEQCAAGIAHVRFIGGGAERQHSIAAALALLGSDSELVLIHDAARPCASRALVERVVGAALEFGAAIPAMAINETVKRVDETGMITETLPRHSLRAAQTPQGFRRDVIIAAYAAAEARGHIGTDDASLVEAAGGIVHVVEGEPGNIKITLPGDFACAELVLRAMAG